MPAADLPLALRIDLAEAFIELSWAALQAIPPGRGYDTNRAAEEARANEWAKINKMLEAMLPMYDARRLEEAS